MPTFATRGLPLRSPLRSFIASCALAAVLLCQFSDSQARAACAAEWNSPAHLSRFDARSSVFCVINEQRAASGLSPLSPNPALGRAALHHSRAMNRRDFFGHRPDGSPESRARRAGYMAGASWWMVAEALGWGRGSSGTPRGVVTAMMASPSHRAVLLDGRFRDIGVGVAMGAPLRGRARNAAIYTVQLGVRR